MILNAEDIIRKEGSIKIKELGDTFSLGLAKVSMHQPTGVVFIEQSKNNSFDRFIIGVITDKDDLQEKKEFKDKTEEDFFNAVNYFEELVQNRMPKEDNKQPSVGKFYFYKKALNKESKVILDGMTNPVIIQDIDIPLVFTPPQNKPLGRLNMTVIQRPEYEIISSKFALKYNEDASTQEANDLGTTLSELAVYDMTPYSNNDDNTQQQEEPQDVNQEPLDINDIEGEDLDDKKNKEKEKKEQKEKQSKKEDKQEKGEKGDKGDKGEQQDKGDKGDKGEQGEQGKQQDKGEQGEQGEKGDKGEKGEQEKQGEQGEQETNQNSQQQEQTGGGEDLESQRTTEEKQGSGKPELNEDEQVNLSKEQEQEIREQRLQKEQEEKEQQKQLTPEQQEQLEREKEQERILKQQQEEEKRKREEEEERELEQQRLEEEQKEQKLNEQKNHLSRNIIPGELVQGLEKMFNAPNLKDYFRKQERLISFMQSYNERDLKSGIYEKLNIPQDFPKKDFIQLVKEKTNNIFN
jgi:hypothetical protein